MSVGDHKKQLYIIKFGLAKKYRDPKTHLHILCMINCSLTGTTPYALINNHLGVKPSCRDDLESLAYVLLYFLCGSLPWHGVEAAIKKQQQDSTLKMKMSLPPHALCSCPKEFSIFLSYSRALRFDDKPDYVYIHRLFRDLFIREGYQYGHPFTRCIMGNSPDDQSAVARAGNNGGQKVLHEDGM